MVATDPLAAPLPGGMHADPTYLAFLRGAGFSETQARITAFQQVAAAHAAYATASSRLPEQLKVAQEGTANAYFAGGSPDTAFGSGERLTEQNRNVVANQQAGQDLQSTQAGAVSSALNGYQTTLADLARQQADQQGALQGRNTDQANAARLDASKTSDSAAYLKALTGGAPNPTGFGAGPTAAGASIGTPGAPGAGPGGQNIQDYLANPALHQTLAGMDTGQQGQWMKFMQAQYPTANFAPVLTGLANIQAQRASAAPAVSVGGGQRVS